MIIYCRYKYIQIAVLWVVTSCNTDMDTNVSYENAPAIFRVVVNRIQYEDIV
jgi:hypothetical protein